MASPSTRMICIPQSMTMRRFGFSLLQLSHSRTRCCFWPEFMDKIKGIGGMSWSQGCSRCPFVPTRQRLRSDVKVW